MLAALELARVLGRRCSGEQGKASPKSAASSWAGVLGNGGGRGSIGALRSIIRACANLAAHIWSRKSCCSKPASQPPRRLTLPSERVAYSPVLPNPAGFEPRTPPVCNSGPVCRL